MRGTVFELPHVAPHARERIAVSEFSARCDVMEGDAMTGVPSGADAYVVKGVIHGRSDDETVAILSNCRAAMAPQGKLLLVERLMPERVDPDDARARVNLLMDVNMMLMAPGGRERREPDAEDLLGQDAAHREGHLRDGPERALGAAGEREEIEPSRRAHARRHLDDVAVREHDRPAADELPDA